MGIDMTEESQVSGTVEQSALEAPVNLPDGQSARPDGEIGHAHESKASIIAAIIANILVGIVKFIAAAISGSSAMVSEGIHSIVDSGNGMLMLFGMRKASKRPDVAHPFGYSHEMYFWTLVVAVMIFALGGGLSIYEGIQHMMEITPGTVMGNPAINYIVIGIAIVIEGFSLSVAVKAFNKARGDDSPMKFIREAKDPSLFTVVLEDSAAELGLVIALLGVFFGHLFDNPYIDGAASLLIGLLLSGVAVVLLRETKGLLIGEGLKASEVVEVQALVERNPDVVECGRILSLYLGPQDLLLTIDATFTGDSTRDDIDRAIDAIECDIVSAFPQTTRIFIEPESLCVTEAHPDAETLE